MDNTGNQQGVPPGVTAGYPSGGVCPPPRRSTGIAAILALILAVLLFLSFSANVVLLALSSGGCAEGSSGKVRERTVIAGGKEKVAIVPVEGVILSKEASAFGEGTDMATKFRDQLKHASQDEKVRGLILEVNSPGGGVTPSDIMYHEIVKFRKKHGKSKPVVTLMKDVAASGGYYISAPTEWIVAHPTSITGSIGVYMGYIRLENLFRKLGVDEEIIKSGGHKDMGSPFRELTEEERAILKGMVSIVFDRFKSIVLEGRGDKVNAHLKVIADGRVFIGSQAKDVGLVDEIGYLDEAVAKISSLSGVQDPTVVRYSARVSILENLMNDLGGIRPPAISDLTKDPYCGLMYLWRPGTMGK